MSEDNIVLQQLRGIRNENRDMRRDLLEPVYDLHDAALRPKIGSAKAQGAGRSHSAVKLCNAGWRDFGPQPEGPGAIFAQYGVAARSCSSATPRSLRLVLRKNDRRRGVVEIMNRLLEAISDVKHRLTSLAEQVSGLRSDFVRYMHKTDSLEQRVERIERRLDPRDDA